MAVKGNDLRRRRCRKPPAGPIPQGNIYNQNVASFNVTERPEKQQKLASANKETLLNDDDNKFDDAAESHASSSDPYFAIRHSPPNDRQVPAEALNPPVHWQQQPHAYSHALRMSVFSEQQLPSMIPAQLLAGVPQMIQGPSHLQMVPVQESDNHGSTTCSTQGYHEQQGHQIQEVVNGSLNHHPRCTPYLGELQTSDHVNPLPFIIPGIRGTNLSSTAVLAPNQTENEPDSQTNHNGQYTFILPEPSALPPSCFPSKRPNSQVPVPTKQRPPVIREDKVNGIDYSNLTTADVLRGRGSTITDIEGNKNFRAIVKNHVLEFANVTAKGGKKRVAQKVVAEIRYKWGGRFLDLDDDKELWFEIGDKKAVEKGEFNISDF